MFKGILITKDESGYKAAVQQIDDAVLPEGDVTVRVEWSTLNYKDGLALTGKSPVVRRFPMVPGIDFAGTVSASSNPAWKAGDRVVLNGWGVGETHCGGLAEVARVRGEWLVPLPAAFTARQAMAIGTAGYTAMLCVLALERHGIKPADGEILVTGANGWCRCRPRSRRARRWPSAPPATRRCYACWRWKGTASSRPTARFWLPGPMVASAAWPSRCCRNSATRWWRRPAVPPRPNT